MRRTVDDWLAEASRSTDPQAIDGALAQACELATSAHELRSVLHAATIMAVPARITAVADRTLAVAVDEREIWGFRDVASARAHSLSDRPGALAALVACERLLDALGAHGYLWVLLGEGFLATLADHEGLRRCLVAGLASARALGNAGDLCAIASAWAKHVERDAGALLLCEAEALAANGTASPWTLANAWHALDDTVAVRRVLDGALAAATTVESALHVHRAWSSHGRRAEAIAALDRAEALLDAELAVNAADASRGWLAVGEAAFDAQLDAARIARAVANAEALATDDATRSRVATAYHVWLHDDVAAERVGPRGVAPEALRPVTQARGDWPSSASALLDWLRGHLPDATLVVIANADYHADAPKHLGALRDIVATGLVPRELGWEPHEVLALSRWATGEAVDHLQRAFCCTVLCLAPQGGDELETNGVILAESCLALGPEASERAAQLFAWCAASSEEPEATVARLLLLLVRAATTPADPRLASLAEALAASDDPPLAVVAGSALSSMRGAIWRDLAHAAVAVVPQLAGPLRDLA